MSRGQDVYQEPIIIEYPGGGISRVYRPVLDDEERARRMKRLEQSAAALLKDLDKRRRAKR